MSDGQKNTSIDGALTVLDKVIFATGVAVVGYAFFAAGMVLLDAAWPSRAS